MRRTRWQSWHAIVVGACLGLILFMAARGFYGLEASPGRAFLQLLALVAGGALLGGVIAFVAGPAGERGGDPTDQPR